MTKTLIILMTLVLIACGRPKDGGPGPKGNTGSTGSTGAQGPQGTPGTSITVEQLCPSYGPTSYPDVWPEQAFCVGGTLYGVYWTGSQAFLAALPPGVYESTSPQGCTLTVGLNCQITQD